MQTSFKLAGVVAAFLSATSALADATNAPDPYAAGFGFDAPQEASWGGWTRGAGDSLYAEWDTFVDASYAGVRTAAAGSGNLYSFSVTEKFSFNLTDSAQIAGSVRSH